ncbi:MAG: hypothetical protein ACJ77B_02510, partial [Chloroflexota bacterium]
AGTLNNVFAGTPYALSESGPSGYSTTGQWSCSTGGTLNPANNVVTVALGADVTCTITNTDNTPTLKLVKVVDNNDGGTNTAHDWTLSATAAAPNAGRNFSAAGDAGTVNNIFAGTEYALAESTIAGYTAGYWSCTGGALNGAKTAVTVSLGSAAVCTIHNADNAPTLLLQKNVINDNGGTATAANWTLSAATTATGFTGRNFSSPGNATVGNAVFAGKTYSLSESTVYGYGSTGQWDCTAGTLNVAKNAVTLALGQHATCTITNNDLPGTIIVKKVIKPTGSQTVFPFDAVGTGYADFGIAGGQQNSQSLGAGTYSVKELVGAGWTLTGIGGSTDPATPFNCTTTGSGGSTGVGSLATQTVSISLKNGDTVTCVFENTGQGTTRTQGFWSTHPLLASAAWFGGTTSGHTFPGVAAMPGIGDRLLCGRAIDTNGKLMGAFWSAIPKTSSGAKREAIDQARMQLLQQLVAAELNRSAFGTSPGVGSFAGWETALCGTNVTAIKTAAEQAGSFNEAGDAGAFTPGASADSKGAKALANIPFWDVIQP